MIRILATVFLLLSSLAASAQVPPPVPALPDTERRTAYNLSGSTCACAVNFAIYGDGGDVDAWIQVWLNGVEKLSTDPAFGWVLSSPTGPITSIPRPITDAILTFNQPQTGALQILGARRPRRTTQFIENRGVAARDLNQAFTDVIAQNRETWDRTNDLTGRALLAYPGEQTWANTLPPATNRAGLPMVFDGAGRPSVGTSTTQLVPVFQTTGSIGGLFQPVGADPTGAADSTTAIQACLNAAQNVGTCLVTNGKYKILGNLAIPAHATLSCGNSFWDSEDGGLIPAFGTLPALMLDGAHTISASGTSATIRNCLIYRNGMTFPAADSSLYTGIAVTDAGFPTFTLLDTVIIGFDTCYYNQPGSARPFIQHVHCDATGVTHAAMEFDQGNTDSGVARDIKIQPIGTGNGVCGKSQRAGTGFRIGANGGPVVLVDEVISQNFQVAQFDFESFTMGGQIWADNINGTGAGCSYGSSIGVLIGAGSSIEMYNVNIAADQTGLIIIGNGAQSWVGTLRGSCFGQDALQIGDATHSGNLDVSSLQLDGDGCTGISNTSRYAINMLHVNDSVSVQHGSFVRFQAAAGHGPYFAANFSVPLTNSSPTLWIANQTNDIGQQNPFQPGPNVLGAGFYVSWGGELTQRGLTTTVGLGATPGLGSTGTVTLSAADPIAGTILINPGGTGIGTTGGIVLTQPNPVYNTWICVGILGAGGQVWPAGSIVQVNQLSRTQFQFTWNSNGSPLVAGAAAYTLLYNCQTL